MMPKIGLALGGGGARGLAHVGVLKVLEQEGLPIDCIAGTSIGAIVGAMYAQHPDSKFLVEKFKASLDAEFYEQLGIEYLKTDGAKNGSILHQVANNIKRRIVINLAQSRKALLKDVRLKNVLARFLEPCKIEDCNLPLAIVATSLLTGEDRVYTSGDIIERVAASCAIPGFLEPVHIDEDILTDGGVSCPVPVEYVRQLGAEFIISVNVSMKELYPLVSLNVIEIISRADMIMSRKMAENMARKADIAIFPETKDIHWSDFDRADELIQAGIDAATQKIPEIKRKLKKYMPWYRRIFS